MRELRIKGVTWLFKVRELQVRCGRPAKPGSQGKGQAPHVAPLMDTPLPLFAPCRGPPSSLPSASLYISPARFWSSLSCQTTCKAELRTLGASAEALTTSPVSGEFVEKGHQLAWSWACMLNGHTSHSSISCALNGWFSNFNWHKNHLESF